MIVFTRRARLEGLCFLLVLVSVQLAAPNASCPAGEPKTPVIADKTLVFYDAVEKKLKVDTNKSSLTEGPKSVEAGPSS